MQQLGYTKLSILGSSPGGAPPFTLDRHQTATATAKSRANKVTFFGDDTPLFRVDKLQGV